jgi:hypothetical protein
MALHVQKEMQKNITYRCLDSYDQVVFK